MKFKKKFNKKSLQSWAGVLIVALTIRWGVAEAYVIPSGSMEPTLEVSDRIIVNKWIYGWRVPFTKIWFAQLTHPQRGEVVVFKYPKDESLFYIKRIIGLPGDVITYSEQGVLTINGQVQTEGAYETKLAADQRPRAFGPIQVPANQFFVMGDNRDNSNDSRYWGFLPRENLMGRAEFKWWSHIR